MKEPKEVLVEDLVKGTGQCITKTVVSSEGYIIFNRYFDYSNKSEKRQKRIGLFKKTYRLPIKTKLPTKEICISSAKKNENLIQIIADEMLGTFMQRKVLHKLLRIHVLWRQGRGIPKSVLFRINA